MRAHYVETFTSDDRLDYGWQCFTCGRERDGYDTFTAAEEAGIEHSAHPDGRTWQDQS